MAEKTCLLVGGGLTGLIGAAVLARRGWRVQILDKGRGIGGRLASRRLTSGEQTGCFDFGAQYFTVGSPQFQPWVQEWLDAGVIVPWSEGFPTLTGTFRNAEKVAYRGAENNRSLAQYLAAQLAPQPVLTQRRVLDFRWREGEWRVRAEVLTDGAEAVYSAQALALTAPVPQCLELLERSEISLKPDIRAKLENVTYAPCLTLLALLEEPAQIPPPGGLWLTGDPLGWIACNHQKGVSPQGYAVTIQAGPQWSADHFEAETEAITAQMLEAARPWLGSKVLTTHLHRWRYSQVLQPYPEPCLSLPAPGPLVLGGDGFVGGKVEGAALSGLALAQSLLVSL
ncbi:MAG: NAD(P)-binding protein [Cyanobacteria bacterium RI_101]|nr:NAD(P)-binding protein [Cyanobacteria bacterium RI_101]